MAGKIGAKNISAKPSRDRDLLVIYKRSVAAFCHECARSPLCPNAKCELRAASPLKTADDIELMRPVRRPTKWTEERKQEFSKKMKAQWADPEIKERRVAATRKGVAEMGEQGRKRRNAKVKEYMAQRTPEQVQAHVEKTAVALQKGREEYQAKQAAAKE
jgi:hypothetical protein